MDHPFVEDREQPVVRHQMRRDLALEVTGGRSSFCVVDLWTVAGSGSPTSALAYGVAQPDTSHAADAVRTIDAADTGHTTRAADTRNHRDARPDAGAEQGQHASGNGHAASGGDASRNGDTARGGDASGNGDTARGGDTAGNGQPASGGGAAGGRDAAGCGDAAGHRRLRSTSTLTHGPIVACDPIVALGWL